MEAADAYPLEAGVGRGPFADEVEAPAPNGATIEHAARVASAGRDRREAHRARDRTVVRIYALGG